MFPPVGNGRTLPRLVRRSLRRRWGEVGSGYTKQPRALALGYAQRESALKVAAEARL